MFRGNIGALYIYIYMYGDNTPTMENQMEKNMENDMETGVIYLKP